MKTQFHDPSQAGSVPLETVLSTSDVISLHCPLTPTNIGLMNSRTLGLMKPTAFLVNTSRGGLVVDRDLADALHSGRLAGAGLDVLTTEPPSGDNPLLNAKNCIVTPHIAWASFAARNRLLNIVTKNVETFLAGNPQNVVNP
jgi:glycerate dehydrogenase